MPALRSKRLPGALREAYETSLERACLHFKCRRSVLASLVIPFTNVNWKRYRNPNGPINSEKVHRIMRVLERSMIITPDPTWWRDCMAESAACHVLLRTSDTLAWLGRWLNFVKKVIPLKDFGVDLAMLSLNTPYASALLTMSAPGRGSWKLKVRAEESALVFLLEKFEGGRWMPQLAGTWSREFWLRCADVMAVGGPTLFH